MEVFIKRILYLLGLVLLIAWNDVWAGSCVLKEEHIKELALVVICAAVNTEPLLPFKKSYMVESGNDLGEEQEPPEPLKQICRGGLSNIAKAASVGSLATFALASEYFFNHYLIRKMMGFVTDAMVDDFMKGVGITRDSQVAGLRRLGFEEVEDQILVERQAIRQRLAKVFLARGGYLPLGQSGGSLAYLAADFHPDIEKVFENIYNGHSRYQGGNTVWNKTRAQKFAQVEKKIAERAIEYLQSQSFRQTSTSVLSAFGRMFGALKIPFKFWLRIPGYAAVGPLGIALTAGSFLVGSNGLGCTDKPVLGQIISQDSENQCRPIDEVTPPVLNGLRNPSETKGLLDTDASVCEAYSSLYRQLVLQIPTVSGPYSFSCQTEPENGWMIRWQFGSVQGFKVTKKPDGNHLYFRPDSRTSLMGAWVEPTSEPLPSYNPMVRELSRHCSGLDSVLSPVLFYDNQNWGHPQKRPSGAGLTDR